MQSVQRLTVASLANWIALAAALGGFYLYVEHSLDLINEMRRDMQSLHQEVQRGLDDEKSRDAAWMIEESQDFEQVRSLIEKGHGELLSALSTANDDLNYRLGKHVGDHRVLERLIKEGMQ